MFALLKNGKIVLLGDEEACWANCPPYHEDEPSWTITYTDANEGPEEFLYEQWEAQGATWMIAKDMKGIAAALTS
mgnify:CR=1 FL=1